MVLFAKVVISTLALLPFFVFIEKRLGQHCTSTHLYEAIVVRKPHIAFIDKDIHNALIKCTRERFREALYHYVTNANSVVNTSGMFELSESTPQREFYSPQELE